MLEENLIDLANNIQKKQTEAQTIEVKSAHKGCPKRLYDTLSSFSNQDSGGIILFGLNEQEDFKIVGVYDLHDLQKKVMEQCLQMEPPVRAVFTFAEINGLDICSAEIPSIEITERPCYYKGIGRVKGSYIRVGDADLPMTDYELYSYEAFRKHLHDDERPVNRASLKSLDDISFQKYVLEKQIDRPKFAQLPIETAYEMLNILRNGIPTIAALMNFGIYPQGYLPQLCITAIVVPGTQIGDTDEHDTRFLDNKRIEGNLATMLADATAFCNRNMKIQTIIDKQTGNRKDRTEYPITAIREAILNALIHRDYSIYTEGTPIQINFFTDRLEIHSPGSLYGRMTIDQLGIAKPDLRNPALAVMAEALTDAENRYSGIPTMRNEMAKANLPAPVFENRRNEFVVIFYNSYKDNVSSAKFNEDVNLSIEDKILAFCETPKTRTEIAHYLGIKTKFYVMSKYINPLVNKNELLLTIPDKPKSRNQKYYSVQK